MTAYTENGDKAFSTSGNALVDAFYSIVRDTTPERSRALWERAIDEDPRKAFQIALFKRDCRKGQGEKEQTYQFLELVKSVYPRTYLECLEQFVDVGYYKDLLVMHRRGSPSGELDLLSKQVRADALVEDGKPISLAAKYAPSEGKAFNTEAHIMAKLLTNGNMSNYRKMLSRLRARINLIETQLCELAYNDIKFEHIPSRAHKKYQKALKRHMEERYKEYLEEVKTGKKEIKSGQVEPHELLKGVITPTNEALWNDISRKVGESGVFDNVMAMVDVSGSMHGIPMDVAVALGMLIAENNKSPRYKGKLLTFSQHPQLQEIKGKTLSQKVNSLVRFQWDMNTNVSAAFNLLLQIQKILPKEEHIKTLVILSDMQFDQADSNSSSFEHARENFAAHGQTLPNIIFWNLRSTETIPVSVREDGTILASGYSQNMFKIFLDPTVPFDTLSIMEKTLEKYDPKIIEEEFVDDDPIKEAVDKKCLVQ